MVFVHCSLRNHRRTQRTLCTPLDCSNTAQRPAAEPFGRLCRTRLIILIPRPKNIPTKTPSRRPIPRTPRPNRGRKLQAESQQTVTHVPLLICHLCPRPVIKINSLYYRYKSHTQDIPDIYQRMHSSDAFLLGLLDPI
jgi:hypothetical protein